MDVPNIKRPKDTTAILHNIASKLISIDSCLQMNYHLDPYLSLDFLSVWSYNYGLNFYIYNEAYYFIIRLSITPR